MIRLRVLACAAAMVISVAATAQRSEMRLDRVRESLTGTHRHYQQTIDGIEVVGGERSETLLPEGAIRVDFERTAHIGVRASSPAAIGRPAADRNLVYVNVDGEARLARRVVVEPRRLEPHAQYFDAETGELLRDDPLFYTAKQGRVFDVNPVAKLNAPFLRDDNDAAAAVPPDAYSEADLPDLNPSGPLTGPNVQIVDLEAPFTTRADAAGSLDFDRSQPQFEEVNAYFQIDRTQRYLQSLGYTGSRRIVAYSIPVDAHAANGTDNSYYIQGSPPGRGTLYFGNGGTDDAEDSDIVLHEFGHAIHDWIVPGALTGASSSQARALSEGFGDYWSFSSTYALTIASGRDPYCIADWDARCAGDDASQQCGYPAGADCLRRVDSTKTMADYIHSDEAGTEHKNGMIWSSALREIFMTLAKRNGVDAGKRIADTIVLESLFGLPPSPDFRTVAQSMIAADRQLRAGFDVDVICAAMTLRGIFAAGDCGTAPRGEWTLFQSPGQNLVIPDGTGSITSTITVNDTRAIVKVAVRVDIAHASRGDLVISLVAPNGTTVKLKESSQTDRTPDVHATFGIDAPTVDSLAILNIQPANGVWKLVVSDVYAGDTGVLQDWDLLITFAGDAPVTTRSTDERIIVPVVGHATGAAGTLYTSDVYLLNRGSRETTATMIFTPSGANGTNTFAAMKATIAPGQTVLFTDIVATVFASTGIGSLEIQGDTTNLLAWSKVVNATATGSLGQSIEAMSSVSAAGASDGARYVLIPPLDVRLNIGAVEVGGGSGSVHVEVLIPGAGMAPAGLDFPIAPYGHTQVSAGGGFNMLVPGHAWIATLTVTGNARVLAYGSIVENDSGDAIFEHAVIPAAGPTTMTVPVVSSTVGVGGLRWSSTMEYANVAAEDSAIATFYPQLTQTTLPRDAWAPVPEGIGTAEVQVPSGGVVTSHSLSREMQPPNGRIGDRVGAYSKAQAISAGNDADVLGVESTDFCRTNFGTSEADGVPADVRVTLFDAAGRSLASREVVLGPRQMQQIPISALYGGTVANGRLHFEVVSGGRVFGYASVVNNANNDSVFELAR